MLSRSNAYAAQCGGEPPGNRLEWQDCAPRERTVIALWLTLTVAQAAEDFADRLYLFGDIHAHTGASGDGGSSDMGSCVRASDGEPAVCGAVSEIGDKAIENGLDFMATVDHVTSVAATTTPENFEQVFAWVNELNAPDEGFITLPGAEIFVELPDGQELGHRSLLFFGTSDSLLDVEMGELQPSGSESNVVENCAVLTSFMAGLEAKYGPVLLIPHHPGVDKPMATNWSCHDPRWAPVVEAYSEHGSSFDASAGFDAPWSGFVPSGTVRAALDPDGYGHRLGLVGGSDNHDTHPGDVCRKDTVLDHHPYGAGLTGVVLDSIDSPGRAEIHEAFTARRTFTTTGPQLPVWVEVHAEGADPVGMGEMLEINAAVDVTVEVQLPEADAWTVQSVRVLTPEDALLMTSISLGEWSLTIPFEELPAYLLVDVAIDGELWFDTPCDDGGVNDVEHIWTSPTWIVSTVADDADDDGFSETDGDCDDTNPFVYPGAPEACLIPGADHDCDGIRSGADPDCEDTDTAEIEEEVEESDTGRVPEREPLEIERPPKEASKEDGGCSVSSAAASRSWWALAMVVLFRRRPDGRKG